MVNKIILNIFFVFSVLMINAKTDKNVVIEIRPTWGNEKFSLNKAYRFLDKSSFNVKTLKFYLTSFKLSNNDKVVFTEKESYHLIDLSDTKSLKFELEKGNKKDFDKVSFQLGVDSLTNQSGAKGGDLDPVKGMYWSWQSGYVNFKMEGNKLASKNERRGVEFEYHLGGYKSPFNSIQIISLNVNRSNTVLIKFDIAQFIKNLNFKKTPKVMSPSKKSSQLAKEAAESFHIFND